MALPAKLAERMATLSFQLYHGYSIDQVLSALRGVRTGDFVGRERAACFAALRSPKPPSFPDRSTFWWPHDFPAAVVETPRVPLELFAKLGKNRLLYCLACRSATGAGRGIRVDSMRVMVL